MKELVRLRMRPSRDKKSFRYMLDYRDQDGKRRQISLGHADKRRAERQKYEKQLELRMNVAEPISMRLTDFFQDSPIRTKGQVRATTLKERAKTMRDFTECVGDIDVQDVRCSQTSSVTACAEWPDSMRRKVLRSDGSF
jgi:hypothetical protein